MARAYLGKISALVTANTSDFQAKLNASAKDVRSFASAMQQSLSKAESTGTSSLRGIYTEAQKVERALRAAASVRLSFKGFDSRNLNTFDQAAARLQRLFSATELINKPLVDARKSFDGLASGVQAAFLPALIRAQSQVELLNQAIERGQAPSEKAFEAVRRRVELTTQAIDRLVEAQSAIGGLARGGELRFQNPGVVAEIERARQLQERVSGLRPQEIQAGGFSELIARQRAAADEAARLQSELEKAKLVGGDVSGIVAAQERARQAFQRTNDEVAAGIKRFSDATRERVEFVVTGNVQNFDQARSEVARLEADLGRLRQSQREAVAPRLIQLGEIVEAGDIADLDQVRRLIASIGSQIAGLKGINLKADQELESVKRLRAGLAGIADSIGEPSDPMERLRRATAEANKDIDRLRQASIKVGAGSAEADRLASSLKGVVVAAQNAASQTENLADKTNLVDDAIAQVRTIGTNAGRQAGLVERGPQPVSDNLGLPTDAINRQLERLRSTIVSTKDQIAALPLPLRQQFIPDIARATSEFNRLRNAPSATAEEIERAANELQRLEAGVRRATNAATAFGRTFEDVLTDSAIKVGQAQLQALQGILIKIGATAGGPAAAAFDALSNRLKEVMADGTIALPAVQEELQRLINAALLAAAASGKISFKEALAQIKKVGDVARGAFGNAGLAVQQAIFAFDDFFSVTGDLSQRIRAAGNNISQLGFILGGTEGLIAGVAIAVTAQLVAALIKWYSTGASTEAQVKALNDLLAREKTLVEELADSFNRLADSIGDIRVDEQTDALRRQRQELEEIRKKQEELNSARVFAVDPAVQRERALQTDLQQQLERSANPAERIALARRLNESRIRQEEAERNALARPDATSDTVARDIAESLLAVRLAQIEANRVAAPGQSQPFVAEQARRQQDKARAQSDLDSAASRALLTMTQRLAEAAGENVDVAVADEQLRQLNETIRRLEDERESAFSPTPSDVSRTRDAEIERLELLRREIEARRLSRPRDEAVRGGRNAAVEANRSLQQALDFVAESTRGGGSELRNALTTLQEELAAATRRLGTAQTTEGQAGLEAATAAAKEIDAINEKINAELSAAETTKSFADALDRAAFSLLQVVADESRQAADQARRDANRLEARRQLGFATVEDVEFQRSQERQRRLVARETEREALFARQRVEGERLTFEQRARAGEVDDETAKLVRSRDEAAALEQAARKAGNAREELQARFNREVAQLALDQRFEASDAGARARKAADEVDQQAAKEDEFFRSTERGRELERTPAQRAASDLRNQLEDLQNRLLQRRADLEQFQDEQGEAFPEEQAQARLAQIRAENDAARQRIIQDSLRAAAPGIFALRDSVENAVLQGPSRAALNAADINTEQGRSELNRLLRGDDPAKQADVVELQKQSTLLQTVIDLLREQGVPLVVN